MSRGRTVGKCRYDGKVTFRSYRAAESASHRLPEPGEPYFCKIAGGWHIRRGDQAEYDRRQALRWSVNSSGGEGDSTGAVGAVGRVEA